MKNVLEIENLSKDYKTFNGREKVALKDISFNLEEGQSLGIIGKNGSGKSTLLKLIAGILKPTKGTIKYKGTLSSILDLGSGILPDLTGIDNINLIGQLIGLSKSEIRKQIEEIIDFSELEESINQPVKAYSSGMYLRLAFSIKTIFRPDILLLDEIISVGDYSFQEKSMKKIKQLKQNGVSIILASHSNAEILKSCNNCILLANGSIEKVGDVLEVLDYYSNPVEFLNSTSKEKRKSDHPVSENGIRVLVKENQQFIRMKDSFSLEFEINKTENSTECDLVLLVKDLNGLVLSDSLLYREHSARIPQNYGSYILKATFPPNIFNQGIYYFTIVVGNGENELVRIEDCAKINVRPDEWEENKQWNRNGDYFPFRLKLDWDLVKN